MIEILADDNMVNIINYTGKKISIKHYVNTYLFPVKIDEKGNNYFPLYYRVIFNKQSVKIKSNINKVYSPDNFMVEKISQKDKHLMRREALALTHIVSKTFTEVIDKAIEEYKKEKWQGHESLSEVSKNISNEFDINQIFGSFNFHQFELPFLVESRLLEEIQEYAKILNEDEDILGLFNHGGNMNAFQLLQYLKTKNNKWLDFEQRFDKNIWFFNIHYYKFLSHSNEFKILGATYPDLILSDAKSYNFSTLQINSLFDEDLNLDDSFNFKSFSTAFSEFYQGTEIENLIYQVGNIL